MEGTENMTPQERELLTYLEDLQQNNPAEYELLVKDLNEKRAAEGKGPHAVHVLTCAATASGPGLDFGPRSSRTRPKCTCSSCSHEAGCSSSRASAAYESS